MKDPYYNEGEFLANNTHVVVAGIVVAGIVVGVVVWLSNLHINFLNLTPPFLTSLRQSTPLDRVVGLTRETPLTVAVVTG